MWKLQLEDERRNQAYRAELALSYVRGLMDSRLMSVQAFARRVKLVENSRVAEAAIIGGADTLFWDRCSDASRLRCTARELADLILYCGTFDRLQEKKNALVQTA